MFLLCICRLVFSLLFVFCLFFSLIFSSILFQSQSYVIYVTANMYFNTFYLDITTHILLTPVTHKTIYAFNLLNVLPLKIKI